MNQRNAIQSPGQKNMDMAEQETSPLELSVLSAATFCAYLKQYCVDPLRVALVSQVRYLTVWNIQHGNPIRKTDALLVRHGLHKLTGFAYTALIVTHSDGEEKKAYEAGASTKS